MFERRECVKPWEGKIDPFKIIGNVYFAGTFQASCHIIDTGDGLILVDPGYSDSFYLVIRSIYELGFNPKDIKYIINTHWHGDHTEATKALVDLSGAKTIIGKDDGDMVVRNRLFVPDIRVKDGDTLTLGNTEILFMETPGHTKGTISFFFNTQENGQTYRVGMFGGAGANTMVPERFEFANCREAYRNSLHRLQKENVDVFIGNHVWNNDTFNKAKILKETGENKFIDKDLWHEFIDFCEKRLDAKIEKEN